MGEKEEPKVTEAENKSTDGEKEKKKKTDEEGEKEKKKTDEEGEKEKKKTNEEGEKKPPVAAPVAATDGGEGGGRKDDGGASEIITIVLKLDLHCDGCAKKVKRAIRHYEGVEDVKAELSSNKLMVKGTVDPIWLRDKVATKTKKNVELVSPQPKKDGGGGGAGGGGGGGEKKSEKKPEAKKSEDKPKEVRYKKLLTHDSFWTH